MALNPASTAAPTRFLARTVAIKVLPPEVAAVVGGGGGYWGGHEQILQVNHGTRAQQRCAPTDPLCQFDKLLCIGMFVAYQQGE